MKQIKSLNPANYSRHPIHGEERIWAETNCYVDVLVELIHGLGFDPVAALPFTLGIDFEGDQWTFFKYPLEDLNTLYGMEIQELNPWRSLVHHVDTQLELGRPVLLEMDSFFLPDTKGSAYKLAHVKSTIAVNALDIEKQYMGYFHGPGYFELQGQDFVDIFQLEGLVHERMLPPYIEHVKMRELNAPLDDQQLYQASVDILRRQLQQLPVENPFNSFKQAFVNDLQWLTEEGIETFHDYSFATLRQAGACFELAATYVHWLSERGPQALDEAEKAFSELASMAKALQFQLARTVARKKPIDFTPLEAMAGRWEQGMAILKREFA